MHLRLCIACFQRGMRKKLADDLLRGGRRSLGAFCIQWEAHLRCELARRKYQLAQVFDLGDAAFAALAAVVRFQP